MVGRAQGGWLSISIHALLAESDIKFKLNFVDQEKFLSTLSLRRATRPARKQAQYHKHFYPRSPCGERHPHKQNKRRYIQYFYPRSPCGERQCCKGSNDGGNDFYPRSPCGERPIVNNIIFVPREFLSTLSLRRATPVKVLACTS